MRSIISVLLLSVSLTFSANAYSPNETFEKALSSFQQGKLSEAEIHVKNILKNNSKHIATRVLLAEILIAKGNGAAAEIELNFAKLNGVDHNRIIPLLAESYILQRRFQEVKDITSSGELETKAEAQLNFLRGQAYIGLRQLRSADQAFQDTITFIPNHQKAYLGRAQVAISQRKYNRAMSYIDKALSFHSPSVNAWLMKASLLQKIGKDKKSLEAIEKAIEISPQHLLSRLTRASIYINYKEFKLAKLDIDNILSQIPNEPRAKYLNAIVNAALGDPAKSKQHISEVITTLSAVPDEIMKTTPGYYYLAGLTNFEHDNLNEARRYLVNYIEYEASDLRAVSMIARIDIENREFISALRILRKANIQHPDNPSILTLLGVANQGIGNLDKSEFYFNKVITLAPNVSKAITNLARTKILRGKYHDAINDLLAQSPDAKNHIEIQLMLVESYQKSNQLNKAKAIIDNLLKSFPDNSFLYLKLGNIIGLSGDIKTAKKHFGKVLQLEQDNLDALIHLARISIVEGNIESAFSSLDSALKESPDNVRLLSEKANAYLMIGDPDKALRWYQKAYTLNRDNISLITELVKIMLSQRKIGNAVDLLDEYLGRHSDSHLAYRLLGNARMYQNDTAKAIAAYQEMAKQAANKGEAYIHLASVQLKAGQINSAKRSLYKAIAWDEDFMPAYIKLAKIAISEIDIKQAELHIAKIASLETDTTISKVLMAELHIKNKAYDEGESILLTVLKQEPSRRALLDLIHIYQKKQQFEKALEHLSMWLIKQPDDLLVELAFASTLKQNNELEKAQRVFSALVQKYPNSSLVLNNAASTATSLGSHSEAISLATKANEITPKNINFMDTLAWAYLANEQAELALPIYRDALLINYSNPMIKYHLALTLDKLDRRQEAQKQLIEVVDSSYDFSDKEVAEALLKKWLNK